MNSTLNNSLDANPRILQAGDCLDHYRLDRLLAIGGMGLVFAAYDENLHRPVAVKAMAPQWAAEPLFANRFLAEARAAAALLHPNIVSVYDVGEWSGTYYIVMELLNGEHLAALLSERGRLAAGEVAAAGQQAALGLEFAHRQGVLHGDVKPENLVLTNTGVVKLLDFGLARRVTDPSGGTESGWFNGTPEYASPEAVLCQPTDHRGDIYSLGATLYHLLAGRPPFTGPNPELVLRQQLSAIPPSLHELRPNLPQQLVAAIERCLAKEPSARHQTYADLIRELQPFCTPPPRRPRLDLNPSTPPPPTETARRITFSPTLVAIVGLLAAGGYWYRQHVPPPAPPTLSVANATPAPVTATPSVSPQAGHPKPLPPPVKLEDRLGELLKEHRERAATLADDNRFGEAWAVFTPTDSAEPITLPVQRALQAERDAILQRAWTVWEQTKTKAADLLRRNDFAAALQLCDNAKGHFTGLPAPDLLAAVAQERQVTLQAQSQFADQLAAAEAAQKAFEEKARAVEARLAPQLALLQFEDAHKLLQREAVLDSPAWQQQLSEWQTELEFWIKLRDTAFARHNQHPGERLRLPLATAPIEGELAKIERGSLTLRQQLGTAGSAEVRLKFSELPTAAVLGLVASRMDTRNSDELLAYAALLQHLAVTNLARPADARAAFAAVVRADASKQEIVQVYLHKLAAAFPPPARAVP